MKLLIFSLLLSSFITGWASPVDASNVCSGSLTKALVLHPDVQDNRLKEHLKTQILTVAREAGLNPDKIVYYEDSFVLNLLNSTSETGLRKLEIGPGKHPICLNCDYLDITPDSIEALKQRFGDQGGRRFILGDARTMPYEDGTLHALINRAFSWMPTTPFFQKLKAAIFREAFRTLDKDGYFLIFQIPSKEAQVYFPSPFEAIGQIPHINKMIEEDPRKRRSLLNFTEATTVEYYEFSALTLRGLTFDEAQMIVYAQVADEAKKAGFEILWFRTPTYTGMLLKKP